MAANDTYTQTGKGFLGRMAGYASFLPFGLSTPFVTVLGAIDTLIESGQWLLKGKFGSAATVAAAGTVQTMVNGIEGAFWWLNAGSGVVTGRSLGNHARALTENAIGGVTGALGARPTVLSSYPAGIGSIGGGAAPTRQGPGSFASRVAQERGQDPQARWESYRRGDGAEHVAALEAAAARGGNQYAR